MPQIEPRMISNQLQSSVFLYTCQSADVMEIIKKRVFVKKWTLPV